MLRPVFRLLWKAAMALSAAASAQPLEMVACPWSARSVLARYAAWRGGSAFARLQAIGEMGVFSDDGLHGAGERQITRNVLLRSRSQFGPFSTKLQVTPAEGDYTDLAGQRLPLSPLEVGYVRADAALLLPLPAGSPRSVSLKATETIEGRAWEVVEVE